MAVISYRNDLSYFFYLQVTMMIPTKFQVSLAFRFRRGSEKYILKMAAILDFR